MEDIWINDRRALKNNFVLQDFKCCASCKNCSYDIGGGLKCCIYDRQHVNPLCICNKYVKTSYECKVVW